MQKPASAENATPSSSRINPTVFYGSIIGILAFLAFAMLLTEQADVWIGSALGWTIDTFGWFYMLAIVAYLVFGVLIACSRFGRIRLGPDDSRPEFSLLSWSAMLFATASRPGAVRATAGIPQVGPDLRGVVFTCRGEWPAIGVQLPAHHLAGDGVGEIGEAAIG